MRDAVLTNVTLPGLKMWICLEKFAVKITYLNLCFFTVLAMQSFQNCLKPGMLLTLTIKIMPGSKDGLFLTSVVFIKMINRYECKIHVSQIKWSVLRFPQLLTNSADESFKIFSKSIGRTIILNVNNLEIETRANVITSFCLMNESINQVKQIRFPLKLWKFVQTLKL